MKKEKEVLSISKMLIRCVQQFKNLLPLIFGALVVGYTFNIVFRHVFSFNLNDIRQQMATMHKQWNIAKDPDCRRYSLAAPTSAEGSKMSVVYDYDESNVEDEHVSSGPTPAINEIWKDPGLLNLGNFRWIMNNESICQTNPMQTDTRILPVLIHTWRDHFSQREAIRETWGSIPIYKKWDLRLVFLLGEPDTPQSLKQKDEEGDSSGDHGQTDGEQKKLEDEQEQHGDLVMGSFIENVRTLTYKHMMGYKWILNYCPNATFVIKVDEDKFVDIIKWLDWRTQDIEILESKSADDEIFDEGIEKKSVPDLYCNLFSGGKPIREKNSNYYASPEDWPEEVFTDYCSGWAYGITVDLMRKQYSVSAERKFFWIDDVYFGALLDLVKKTFDWEPVISDCFKTFMGQPDKYRNICEENGEVHMDREKEFGPVVLVHQGSAFKSDMMCLWNKTLHDSDYKFY